MKESQIEKELKSIQIKCTGKIDSEMVLSRINELLGEKYDYEVSSCEYPYNNILFFKPLNKFSNYPKNKYLESITSEEFFDKYGYDKKDKDRIEYKSKAIKTLTENEGIKVGDVWFFDEMHYEVQIINITHYCIVIIGDGDVEIIYNTNEFKKSHRLIERDGKPIEQFKPLSLEIKSKVQFDTLHLISNLTEFQFNELISENVDLYKEDVDIEFCRDIVDKLNEHNNQ